MKLHLNDKSIELISEDELDNQSLVEIMKIHFQPKPNQLNEITKVYVQDEPGQIGNFHYLGSNTTTTLTAKQIHNRKINRRHRANRYPYEVICRIYPLFSITKVKQILKSMNIYYVNINMVRHILFIGLNIKPWWKKSKICYTIECSSNNTFQAFIQEMKYRIYHFYFYPFVVFSLLHYI
jgi:hypothetical protein